MQVPLEDIFAQQAHVAAIRSLIQSHSTEDSQICLMDALDASRAPQAYKEQVLNVLIRHLDIGGLAIADVVSNAHAESLISPHASTLSATTPSKVYYKIRKGPPDYVEIEETKNTLSQHGGTGYRTWEAGVALADLVVSRMHLVQDGAWGPTIELGAGTGLVGLTVAKTATQDLLLTDGDERVVGRLKDTVQLNNVDVPVVQYWWGNEDDTAVVVEWINKHTQPITIITADVLYDPANYRPLLDAIFTLFQHALPASRALVSTTVRDPESYEDFKKMATEKGFKTSVVFTYKHDDPNVSSYFYFPPGPPIEILSLTLA